MARIIQLIAQAAGLLTLGWSDRPAVRLRMRMLAAGAARVALQVRARTLDPASLGRVMVIAPHPDDESFGCGGTVAALTSSGHMVHVVFVTDGSASHPRHPLMPPAAIAAVRREECRLATSMLGIPWSEVTLLDEADGELARAPSPKRSRIAQRIAVCIARFPEAAVLVTCRRDGSSEHEAAFEMTREAVSLAGGSHRLLEYPVWACWNPILLVSALAGSGRLWRVHLGSAKEAKARAIGMYRSQLEPLTPQADPALPRGFASLLLQDDEFLFENAVGGS